MPFERIFDESYPRVYDTWESNGVKYIVQDLPAEDDETAIKILVDNLCTDEVLCNLSELVKDPESVHGIVAYWRYYLAKRMSLGCYAEINGEKKLVGLNVCYVGCKGEHDDLEIIGKKWKNVYDVLEYGESKYDVYALLGMDKILHALGLVVAREYRGAKFGARLLNARTPLSLSQGVKGTATVFTGIASQTLAYKCGFTDALVMPISELAEIGLDYPKNDDRVIKFMIKKFE
ncbi:hypothetical protein O3G_MSEX002598 [Manduca sexta]|uniref:N-acetyltransferase domain-containing protein n=1 Tax=Manduca sexta TaxID=7130 RepID=A0A921YP25_MANSE|nr:hypothetical protein O3G_MSEX002598 [Manduca sexta]